jgi:hypothetical protein
MKKGLCIGALAAVLVFTGSCKSPKELSAKTKSGDSTLSADDFHLEPVTDRIVQMSDSKYIEESMRDEDTAGTGSALSNALRKRFKLRTKFVKDSLSNETMEGLLEITQRLPEGTLFTLDVPRLELTAMPASYTLKDSSGAPFTLPLDLLNKIAHCPDVDSVRLMRNSVYVGYKKGEGIHSQERILLEENIIKTLKQYAIPLSNPQPTYQPPPH